MTKKESNKYKNENNECKHHTMEVQLRDVAKESEEYATMMIANLKSIL